jgi:hypothetical protein
MSSRARIRMQVGWDGEVIDPAAAIDLEAALRMRTGARPRQAMD